MRLVWACSGLAALLLTILGCASQLPLDQLPLLGEPTPTPTMTPTPTPTPPPTLEPYSLAGLRAFINTAEEARRADRQRLVNAYVALLPQRPLAEADAAALIYQGPGFAVAFNGDLNNWILDEALPFTRIDATDFWYLLLPLEPDARIDYKLVVDGEERLDPRNPLTEVSGLGPRSKLVMPAYEPPSELAPGLPPLDRTDRGRLEQQTIDSAVLGEVRTAFVYRPAGWEELSGRLPSAYFHDGTDYINLIDATDILDRLIASGEIPPLVAVFVPPIDRQGEYLLNDAYVAFMADELVPFIQSAYRTSNAPARTAIIGPSLGGLAAIDAAISRPGVFGLVGSQSAALSLPDGTLIGRVRALPARPTRYHLVVGTYETAVGGDPARGDFLAANRRFSSALRAQGYDFHYEEIPEGHSWGLWQATLGDALRYLFAEE